MPTKATLFGLDVRFRHIDEKIAAEKAARSATRPGATNKNNGVANRHALPQVVNPKLFSSTGRKPANLLLSKQATSLGKLQDYTSTNDSLPNLIGTEPTSALFRQKPTAFEEISEAAQTFGAFK